VLFLCTAASPPLNPPQPIEQTNSNAEAAFSWPKVLQAQIVRLAGTEFRLRIAAGSVCKREFAESGLVIDYIGSYNISAQRSVRDATGMGDMPTVIGIVEGSPAAQTDVEAGDAIIAINGRPMTSLIAQSPDTGLLPDQIRNMLATLPADNPVQLTLQRHGSPISATVTPQRLCGTHFLLKPGSTSIAWSDGYTVAIGGKLMNSVETEDELALIAGHELAHVIYGDENASSLKERRRMEDRADLLGADLARCAGYDVPTGLAFWRRFNAQDGLRWLRDPSHRNVPERIRRMTAHIQFAAQCPPAPRHVDEQVEE
jgi:hypothetical protein